MLTQNEQTRLVGDVRVNMHENEKIEITTCAARTNFVAPNYYQMVDKVYSPFHYLFREHSIVFHCAVVQSQFIFMLHVFCMHSNF